MKPIQNMKPIQLYLNTKSGNPLIIKINDEIPKTISYYTLSKQNNQFTITLQYTEKLTNQTGCGPFDTLIEQFNTLDELITFIKRVLQRINVIL